MDLNRKEIKISSITLNLNLDELFIREIFEFLMISDSIYIKVLLCVNEAVINSISHGNKFDQNKVIIV